MALNARRKWCFVPAFIVRCSEEGVVQETRRSTPKERTYARLPLKSDVENFGLGTSLKSTPRKSGNQKQLGFVKKFPAPMLVCMGV